MHFKMEGEWEFIEKGLEVVVEDDLGSLSDFA